MSVAIAIADLMQLPDVPSTPRGLRKLLKRVGVRRRSHGLYEIDSSMVSSFPIAARAELAKKFRSESSEDSPRAESGSYPHADSIPVDPAGGARRILVERGDSKHLEGADLKTELVLAYRDFHQNQGGSERAALRTFVLFYEADHIRVSPQTRSEHPTLKVPTLLRWLRKFERGGPQALIRKESKRRGASIIATTPGMADYIQALISKTPHIRATRVYQGLCARFDRAPDRRTVQNWIARWKAEHPALLERLRNPDQYKRLWMLALGDAAARITGVGFWEMDATRLEVQCLDGLFAVYLTIDVATRRIVATLQRTASADGTARHLHKSIWVLGIPREIKSDWGREFQNSRIYRACLRMGFFTVDRVARPYSGELKPFAERGIGTLLHMFFEQCPGFKGHSVKQAQEIRNRNSFEQRHTRNVIDLYEVSLTAAELQELLDRWINVVYGNCLHAGLCGSTPNAEFAACEARGEVRRVADERLLDVLLGEDGLATVGKKGLRIKGAQFWSDDLIPWVGRRVEWIRTRDAGKLIVYSHEERPQFLTIAEDITASGIDRAVVAIAAKQRQQKWMSEQVADLRRKRSQHRPERLLEEIITHAEAREAAKLAPETSITSMPAHSAGLREAAAALAALELKPSAPLEHADRAEVDAQFQEIAGADKRGAYDEEREAALSVERYQRLCAIPRAKWNPDDCEFMSMARGLPEIRAFTMRQSA